jgi:dihydroflavonol-4-reductase
LKFEIEKEDLMTTLVTGGSGFIGSALVRQLIDRGERVRCLVRAGSAGGNLANLDVERVQGDITDPASIERALDGITRVYHLAALYAIWRRRPAVFYQVNEEGTRNLLAACAAANVERVVHCSSVAALGAHGPNPADETARFNLAHTRDHYHISKFRAEQVALGFARRGLPLVVVNPSVPLGPRDAAPTPSGQIILDIVHGRLPAYLDGGINLIDVVDCAAGMIAAMERGRVGEKYILGNRNLRLKEYFDLIVKTAARGRSPWLKIPRWAAVASGWGYEALAHLTGRMPVATAAWARVGSGYSWWDATKARSELGLRQRPVEDSLADALAWFGRAGYLR